MERVVLYDLDGGVVVLELWGSVICVLKPTSAFRLDAAQCVTWHSSDGAVLVAEAMGMKIGSLGSPMDDARTWIIVVVEAGLCTVSVMYC